MKTTSPIIFVSPELEQLRQLVTGVRAELAELETDYTIEQAQNDIAYLYHTALHFLDLTVERYDLQGQWRPATKSSPSPDMQR